MLQPYTGEWTDVRPTPTGFGSHITALLSCEKGEFFVKATRNQPGGRRDSIVRERLINSAVQPVAPPLRWHAESDEWIALGIEAVEARTVDIAPGSPDLPVVVDILNRIDDLPLPDVARDWPETRWDRFAANEAEAALFRGDSLLHTDINPDNLLIGERDTWAVDWSWPTRGAAFTDPACLVVQLVASGHTAESAETWGADCRAWADADPRAIDAFAAATYRMYCHVAKRRPEEPWLKEMATAAEAWAAHRGITTF